jgi:large subunit ribosomal protein L5
MAAKNTENKDKAKKAVRGARATEAAAEVKEGKASPKSNAKAKKDSGKVKLKGADAQSPREARAAKVEAKAGSGTPKRRDKDKKGTKAVTIAKKSAPVKAEKETYVEHKPAEKLEKEEKFEKVEKHEKREVASKSHLVKAPGVPRYIPRLKKFYETDVARAMSELYKYSSPMAIPKVVKVILNMGMGEATQDKSVVDSAVEELTTIAAQRAVKTYAKKSISNFHLREGMAIGARVTLRGNKMYDFVDKVISVALPRVRDFKGLNTSSFDGRGNYTIGLREQLVFPEIDYDKITKIRGLDVTIVTTASSDEEGYQLLKNLGFPFKER